MHGAHVWVKGMVCTRLQIEIILRLVGKVDEEAGGWEVLVLDLADSVSDLGTLATQHHLAE